MIITKIIEVGINVQNCINIYTDPDNIKQILADRYEGRCFKGCYIKKIEKIRKIGECVINQDGPPTFGVIPVICEVTAIVYAVGEIINGCKVMNRDADGILVCSTDIAAIMLAAHPAFESVVKGQIISIRVGATRYNVSATKIAISAVPYLFNKNPIIYKIGIITEPMRALLGNVFERIAFEEEETNRLKKDNEKAWNTFDQLLYAYKEPQKAPRDAILMNIKTIAQEAIKVQYLSRDPRINLSTPVVFGYTTKSSFPEGAIVREDLPTANVLILLLEDYCAHLRTIREMIEIYHTEKLIADHKNLWQIFKKNKF